MENGREEGNGEGNCERIGRDETISRIVRRRCVVERHWWREEEEKEEEEEEEEEEEKDGGDGKIALVYWDSPGTPTDTNIRTARTLTSRPVSTDVDDQCSLCVSLSMSLTEN